MKFIRKNGRVIPIREKGESDTKGKIAVAAGVAGAATAADAARTSRVYSKAGVTIDRKAFSTYQPFAWGAVGTKLDLKVKGKSAGKAMFYKNPEAGKGFYSFSWLGVKKEFRGQGMSKILSKEAAREIKRQGGKVIENHVVHPGSLLTNAIGKNRDILFKEIASKADPTSAFYTRISRDKAFNLVKSWRTKKAASAVIRRTHLKGLHTTMNVGSAFKTPGMKAKLILGASAAILSGLYLKLRRPKNGEQ